jgi:hypothetical protein
MIRMMINEYAAMVGMMIGEGQHKFLHRPIILPQCNFIHQKSKADYPEIEPGPPL